LRATIYAVGVDASSSTLAAMMIGGRRVGAASANGARVEARKARSMVKKKKKSAWHRGRSSGDRQKRRREERERSKGTGSRSRRRRREAGKHLFIFIATFARRRNKNDGGGQKAMRHADTTRTRVNRQPATRQRPVSQQETCLHGLWEANE